MTDPKPLVSILCQTYNHAHYIRECMEGFLMQKTTFPFVVLIHDDASTDGTADIIKEYEAKYPDIIKPIYQSVNQWSLGKKVFSGIQIPRVKSKYVAWCDGDDYWVDSYKLQKQVDFLETHPDYILVYTDYKRYIQEKEMFIPSTDKICEGMVYEDLLKHTFNIQTPTVCFRKEVCEGILRTDIPDGCFTGDWADYLIASRLGKFKFINEITGVYRVLGESASHFKSKKAEVIFTSKYSKTELFFWSKYPMANTQENLDAKLLRCYAVTKASLITGDYSGMSFVDTQWRKNASWRRWMMMWLAKQKVCFYAMSRMVRLIDYDWLYQAVHSIKRR